MYANTKPIGLRPMNLQEPLAFLATLGLEIVDKGKDIPYSSVDDIVGKALDDLYIKESAAADAHHPDFIVDGRVLTVNRLLFARTIISLAGVDMEKASELDLREAGVFDCVVDGNVKVKGRRPVPTPVMEPEVKDWPRQGSFPGAYLLLGERGSGKTHYLRHQAQLDLLVRFGEPFEDVDIDSGVVSARDLQEAISCVLVMGALGYRLGIDSLRTLVYGLQGAAMSGGMSSEIMPLMTTFSNLFTMYGVSCFLVINPMLSDDDKMSELFLRLASAANGAILLQRRQVTMEEFRLASGRVISSSVGAAGIDAKAPVADEAQPDGTVIHTSMTALGREAPTDYVGRTMPNVAVDVEEEPQDDEVITFPSF